MKRTFSESDSDDGEFNDEEQEQSEGKDSCEASARKKRRGLIEKKRRDRINTCLTELRRLVPAAVERQGSAKLEKAEILQLTVEHLKAIKNAGVAEKAGVSLTHTTDYHSVGFQRCMAETARFLYSMDIPEVSNPHEPQRSDQMNSGTQQSVTGQPNQKPGGLTNVSSAFPRPAQVVWSPQNYNCTASEASKTDPSKENSGTLKHELNNNLSRQGLQFSYPFKHPAVLPIHAPDVMGFPLSVLSPAMAKWPFSVAAKSNIKTPPTLFSPWSPQLFGSQTPNIAF